MSKDSTSGLPASSEWAIEDLEDLLEKDFRKKVLIPLFKKMKYRDVEHTHGTDEHGKDIVFWHESRFGCRINTVVVVKTGNINAQAKGDVKGVGTQIRQAFGNDYLAKKSGTEQQRANRVIVATTGTIRAQSRQQIQSTLNDDVLSRNTYFIDGDEVVELCNRFLGGEETHAIMTPDSPSGPSGMLVSIPDSVVDAIVQRATSKRTDTSGSQMRDIYTLAPKSSKKLRFLPKPESRQQEFVSVNIITGTKSNVVTYGPQDLRITSSLLDGRPEIETAELDPIQIIGRVLTDDSVSNGELTRFELRFSLQGYDAVRVRDAMKLWIAITEGNPFKLVDVDSGRVLFEARWGRDSAREEATPPEELVRYLDDLCVIQELVEIVLTLPRRNLTSRDLLDATELRKILESGFYVEPFEPFSISLPPRDDLNLLEKFAPGEKSFLTLGPFDQSSYDILNRSVELGPGYETYEVVMTEENHESLNRQLEDGITPVEMTFHQAAGSEGVKHYYRNHLPIQHQENFDKHFGPLLEEAGGSPSKNDTE